MLPESSTFFYTCALLAAVAFALESVLQKRGLSHGGTPIQGTFLTLLINVVVYWSVTLIINWSSSELFASTDWVMLFLLSITGLLPMMNFLLAYRAVDRLGASIHISVFHSNRQVLTFLFGMLFLQEYLTLPVLSGIIAVAVGLALVPLSGGGDLEGWEMWELIFSVGAALCIAIGDTFIRYVLVNTELTVLETISLYRTGALFAITGYILYTNFELITSIPRRALFFFSLSGSSLTIALLFLFTAFNLGPVAIASALSGTAPFLTVVFSALFLRDLERVTTLLYLGAAAIVLGVVLITLG